MKRVIVMVGRENVDGRDRESYQMLIGNSYTSADYEGDAPYQFLQEIGTDFAREMSEEIVRSGGFNTVGILNGYKIDNAGKFSRIKKLEGESIRILGECISGELHHLLEGKAALFDVEQERQRTMEVIRSN